MWPEIPSKSIPLAWTSIGILPATWTASTYNFVSLFLDLTISEIFPIGLITPVSLLAHIVATKAVSSSTADAKASKSSSPLEFTPI